MSQALETILEHIWPTYCVGCESYGFVLCAACREALPYIDSTTACPRCGAPFGRLTCTECMTADGPLELAFDGAACALEFKDSAARMIVAYKDRSERRLAPILAELLCEVIPGPWLRTASLITWIPADRKALQRRGFDHMEQIAVNLAEISGRPALRLLDKRQSADQRQLSRQQRAENMAEAFTLAQPPPPEVLLIDDVLTTGATLDVAARALKSAGAEKVWVATVARVW
ncbi:MAG: double zinc ribbon domain-containing protein [Coriobacteriales bacterium]|jgi:ComF family protein|nr:double zinc ribbon domain-containing protein [Coriobacteriales bacterium]